MTLKSTLTAALPFTLPSPTTIAVAVLRPLVQMQDVHIQRRRLREMDARTLADIGVSRAAATREARKLFWS
tara:strand:+ start:243 stop:455 length:213 start_codon:yes stop_codon:yes gene_type:complete